MIQWRCINLKVARGNLHQQFTAADSGREGRKESAFAKIPLPASAFAILHNLIRRSFDSRSEWSSKSLQLKAKLN